MKELIKQYNKFYDETINYANSVCEYANEFQEHMAKHGSFHAFIQWLEKK